MIYSFLLVDDHSRGLLHYPFLLRSRDLSFSCSLVSLIVAGIFAFPSLTIFSSLLRNILGTPVWTLRDHHMVGRYCETLVFE